MAEEVAKKQRAPVEYTPATLEEYKQRYGKQDYSKLGSLGPDLDDESLLMKKAIQEKVKQFSKELHRINRQRASATTAGAPRPPPPKGDAKTNARAKALEFAKQVPRPKVELRTFKGPTTPVEASKGAADVAQERAELEELMQRERQHAEDLVRVAAIKDYLRLLPA